MSLTVIVTSYARPKYLKPCLESLRQDDIKLYVVDGGSDQETQEYIKHTADDALLLTGNPGADYLKTYGIKAFARGREFMITSDDLVFPAGYSTEMLRQYERLNHRAFAEGRRVDWTFCACNLPYLEKKVRWQVVDGVELRQEGILQVAGAIIDTEVCRQVGYFPTQYGKSGQGDRAFSKRLRDLGVKMCYFRHPLIRHIGENKAVDYPQYTAEFNADEAANIKLANADALA